MIFFGYGAKGPFTPFVSIHTADSKGAITRAEMLEMPFPGMVHDFAVTRNWIIVPNFPLTGSMARAMSGKPPFAWEPDKGTHIAFIPRNGTVADAKWVTAPACYVFHRDESLRDRRWQDRGRCHEIRRGAAVPAA